jgi:hypothetical protein
MSQATRVVSINGSYRNDGITEKLLWISALNGKQASPESSTAIMVKKDRE